MNVHISLKKANIIIYNYDEINRLWDPVENTTKMYTNCVLQICWRNLVLPIAALLRETITYSTRSWPLLMLNTTVSCQILLQRFAYAVSIIFNHYLNIIKLNMALCFQQDTATPRYLSTLLVFNYRNVPYSTWPRTLHILQPGCVDRRRYWRCRRNEGNWCKYYLSACTCNSLLVVRKTINDHLNIKLL